MKSLVEPEVVLQDGRPIQQQIEDQLRNLIRTGLLHPGEQLPTLRAVAVGLAVNPEVVRKAYSQLAREGWVHEEEGSGMYVATTSIIAEPSPPLPSLDHLCAEFLVQAACLGYPAATAFRALERYIHGRSKS